MHPHVGRIHVDEDGHIAQNPDPVFAAASRSCSIAGKRELQHLFLRQCPAMLRGDLRQCLGIAPAHRLRPRRPRAGLVLAAQLGIEGVIHQPVRFAAAERFELLPLLRQLRLMRPPIQELPGRLVEQRNLRRSTSSKSTLPLRPASPAMRSPPIQPHSAQEFEAD